MSDVEKSDRHVDDLESGGQDRVDNSGDSRGVRKASTSLRLIRSEAEIDLVGHVGRAGLTMAGPPKEKEKCLYSHEGTSIGSFHSTSTSYNSYQTSRGCHSSSYRAFAGDQ